MARSYTINPDLPTRTYTVTQDGESRTFNAYSGVANVTTTNVAAAGAAMKANNLSDLASASTARTNLGLGTAATTASTNYATAAQGATADAALPLAGGTMTGTLISPSLEMTGSIAMSGNLIDGANSVFSTGYYGGTFGAGEAAPFPIGAKASGGAACYFPAAGGTLATLAGSETLTNKTLTSAIVNLGVSTESATSRTLSASDSGKAIHFTNPAGCDVTLPTSLGVGFNFSAFPTANEVVITAASGVDVNGTDSNSVTLNRGYSPGYFIALAANDFAAHGNVEDEPSNILAYDSFPVAADTALTAYTGTITWALHPISSVDTSSVSRTREGIIESSSGLKYYLASCVPTSANYEVTACVTYATGVAGDGLIARWDASALSGYFGRYNDAADAWEILRFTAGANTSLGTFSDTTLPPARSEITLSVVGSTISLKLNGTTKLSVTDTTYTTAGRVGLRQGTGTCTHHDFLVREMTEASTLALPSHSVESLGWDGTVGAYIQSQATGNQIRFRFTGSRLSLKLDNATGLSGYLFVSISGGGWKRYQLKSGAYWQPIFFNPATTGEYGVRIVLGGNDSTVDNWTTPTNRCRITNIHVATGEQIKAPSVYDRKLMFIGDSISRGRALDTLYYLGDATGSWPYLLGESLRAQVAFQAFSGQGFTATGTGNVPVTTTSIPLFSNGLSRSVDSTITDCFVAHGTNDGGASEAALKAAAQTTWAAARTRYPNAKIYVILPLGYSTNAASPSSVAVRDTRNGYISAQFTSWADGNSQLIDLTEEVYGDSMPGPLSGGSNAYTTDFIHPNAATNALIAADILSVL